MTKKLLTFLTLLTLFFGVGWAETAEFSFNDMGYSTSQHTSLDGVTINPTSGSGVTLQFNKGGGSNAPQYNTGKYVQFYSKNTLTISAGSNIITQVEFTFSGSYSLTSQTCTSGTYDNDTKCWTGSASSFTITNTQNGQTRLLKIKVTYSPPATDPPVAPSATISFDPTTGNQVYSGDVVALSLNGEASGIKYTTNGVDPDADHGTIGTNVTISGSVGAQITVKAVPFNTNSIGTTFGETIYSAIYTIKAPPAGNTYQRIISTNDLEVNEKYIIVYVPDNSSTGYVLGVGNKNSTTRPSVSKDISTDNEIIVSSSDDIAEFTLGGATGAYTFLYDGTYLNGSNGNTDLKINGDGTSDNSKWKITFADQRVKINFYVQDTRYVKWNDDNGFKNYASSPVNVYLYKKVEATGQYTVTCADNLTNGSISASPTTADANTTITITATPDPGYQLSTVTVTPEGGTAFDATVTDNTATFNMPANNVNVTATFSKVWNAINTSILPANCGGDIWVYSGTLMEGVKKAQIGDDIYFRVVTDESNSYQLESLTITDANNNTISYVDDPGDPGWKWEDNRYGAKFKFVMPGTAVTIKATYKQGDIYILGTANDNQWDGNKGVKMTYDASTNTYSANVYFATAIDAGKGQFSFATNLSGTDGSWSNIGKRWGAQSQDYDLVTNSGGGYWTDNVNSQNDYNRFTVPYGVYEIKVNWETGLVTATKKDITVTLDKAAGELETGTTVNVVSNLTSLLQACKSGVSATLAYSTNDGTSYTDGESFAVTEAMTAKGKAYYGAIEAESDSYAYTVVTHYAVTCTANPSKGGTVTADKETAVAGETVTLTINPKPGYEIGSVTVNGDEITPDEGAYYFTMPNEAAAVVANFMPKALTITLDNDNSKGTVYGIPATSTVGSAISFTITPNYGYTVASVTYSFTPTGDPENTQTLTAPYSFNMPAYDVTIHITYNEQSSGGSGEAIDLFHETFGNNSGNARDWNDSYSVKSGVEDVYSGITGYTVSNVKQGKNTTGSVQSGLNQSSTDDDASIIIGPLDVANYTDLVLSYDWKAGSIKGTYYTTLSYATSANGPYVEVDGTGDGATTFVDRTYDLPETAQVSTLYLKIVFYTSNTQAIIDEVNLSGVPNGVQAPVFTPAAGVYDVDVDVTMHCATSGATIYYTDDNSDPKTSTTRKTYNGVILVSQTTTFKAIAVKDGMESDVVPATYTITPHSAIETVTLTYSEPFTEGIGKFVVQNDESGFSPVWTLDGNYGMKGTAYSNGTNYAATSRLISPIIDMTNANIPELTFSHQINSYFTDPSTQCTAWIRETADGVSGTWISLPITITVPASGSWSNDLANINLSDYAGKKVQISFLYTNPTAGTGAGTWEIQNFVVADNTDIIMVNNIAEFLALENSTKAKFKNPVTVLYDYAQYSSNSYHEYIWVKDESGYMQFYLKPTLNSDENSGKDGKAAFYENGDIIPAGFIVTKNYYEYGKYVQAYSADALNAGFEAATKKGLADPEFMDFAVLDTLNANNNDNIATWCNRYITLEKIRIASKSEDNFTFANESRAVNSCVGYNKYYGDGSLLKDGTTSADVTVPDAGDTYYNAKGIIQLWQGGWEFMPIEFTEWKPEEVTLRKLCADGVENQQYTISNRLLGVYADGNKLWVKDDNGQSIWRTTPADGDHNYEIGDQAGNKQLEQSLYDQSNWLEVQLGQNDDATIFMGRIIKGSAITGTFSNKLNPTMTGVTLAQTDMEDGGQSTGTAYVPNFFCAANFYNGIVGGHQACSGDQHHGNFFFMNPKPQEYAQIVWAQYKGDLTMEIPSSETASFNEHKFQGEFKIDLLMNTFGSFNPNLNTNVGQSYNFLAIIQRSESRDGSADYKVFPIDLTEQVPTAVTDVTGKTVAGVKYYNLAGMESERPFDGVNIIVTTYTDGSRSSTKVLR